MRRMLWRAPPGWPEPPVGWVPPSGWRPDPSWPPPPDDWAWWRRAPRSRGQRVALGVLAGVPALVFALLVVAEGYDLATGCGSVDPTDPANYSVVTISNDTFGTVTLADCQGTYCLGDALPLRLKRGEIHVDHAACGASGSDMTSWRVVAADGQVLGYIAVDTPRKRDDLVFRVSRASKSRNTPTPAG